MTEYGGFDGTFAHMDDDGWVNLKTVHEFLQDGKALPPDLATWLGHAIRFSNGDPDEFLRRLGLKKPKGRPSDKHDPQARLKWGERLWELEGDGIAPEAAITTVQAEYDSEHGKEPSRSQLQAWRKEYRNARYPSD